MNCLYYFSYSIYVCFYDNTIFLQKRYKLPDDGSYDIERELGLHLVPKLILMVELPNTNNWTN
jgi:hypothetical protein